MRYGDANGKPENHIPEQADAAAAATIDIYSQPSPITVNEMLDDE